MCFEMLLYDVCDVRFREVPCQSERLGRLRCVDDGPGWGPTRLLAKRCAFGSFGGQCLLQAAMSRAKEYKFAEENPFRARAFQLL